MASKLQTKFPIIDLSMESLKQGTPCWLSTRNKIRFALEEYGLFIAVYDKISSELHDNIMRLSKELLDLPTETKVQNKSDKLGFGYGGNFSSILIEYLGIEGAATLEGTQNFTKLMWPNGNDTFCETALLFSKLLSELGQMVVRMVFESYEAEKGCKSHFDSILYLMRFMKYQQSAAQRNEGKQGLHPHTDKNFWTILDQNQIKGLEIQTKDGKQWIDFEPSPSSFLFIAGEPFMAWSNGRIHPAFHRVTMSGDEPRYSIGLFAFAQGNVAVPEELVDDEHPLQFKPFDAMSFLEYCGKEGMKFKNPIIPYCGVL